MSRELKFRITEHTVHKGVQVIEVFHHGQFFATIVSDDNAPILKVITKHDILATSVLKPSPLSVVRIEFGIKPQ